MTEVIDYEDGISAVDADYQRPRLAAIHLLVAADAAAVIDTGTGASVPGVLAALAAKGIARDRVEYVMLTHIHLDHAAGAGELMRQCPNAVLTVHPRGARHMADPARLIAGTQAVYGEEATRTLYGDILPVPKERILETPAGARVTFKGRRLEFYETAGHARHHVAIHDERARVVFAGDTFGLSYRELDYAGRQFVFPTTSPVQFEPEPYHRSIDLIAALKPQAVYVTHFSRVEDIQGKAEALHRLVDAHAQLALAAACAGATRPRQLLAEVTRLLLTEVRRYGSPLSDERVLEVYGLDVELNAQGLAAWLDTRVKPPRV
jgi:glyoxylase-like metal-dependent hydrolase (beta-lactamase superfamily II)